MIKAKLDAKEIMRQYGQALRRLSELSGMSQRQVLLGEAGIILKTWAGKTKVTTDAKSDLRSRLHLLRSQALTTAYDVGDITINAGARGKPEGRIWRKVRKGANAKNATGGKGFLLVGQLAPGGKGIDWGMAASKRGRITRSSSVWSRVPSVTKRVNQYVNALPAALERGRAAQGLSRQSVVQIAEDLGIDLMAVKGGGGFSAAAFAKAKAAMASSGRAHKNGSGSVEGNEVKTVVSLMNNLPYALSPRLRMDETLRAILAGRAKFFHRSYAAGAFDTMRRAARAYPWMRVVAPSGAE